jgi:hypothetical protein
MDELEEYFVDYESGFIGTLKEFKVAYYNVKVVSSTDCFESWDLAYETLLKVHTENLQRAKSMLKSIKKIKKPL